MRTFALALVLVLGCSGDKSSQPASEAPDEAPGETSGGVPEAPAPTPEPADEPAPPPPPPTGNLGEVDLTLSGMLEGSYQARAADCGVFTIEGQEGRSVKVTSAALGAAGDWDLTIMATTAEEFDRPAVILNIRGDDRASFVWKRKLPEGESVTLHRDGTGADLELTLRDIVGSGTIKVEGTLRCP